MEFTSRDYISIVLLSILTSVIYNCSTGCNGINVDVRALTSKYKYPPGPRGYPIVGVAPMIPPEFPAERLSSWAKQYGEMMTLKLGGTTWVYLNSSRVTKEILEKRSAVDTLTNTSDVDHEFSTVVSVTARHSIGRKTVR
jgi:Cytochrome P450